MNNAEAKFILQGYRPNGSDAGDATFCAAVAQAQADPALGEWFRRQQAFDRALAEKLGQVQPPPELRAAILAGGRVTEADRAGARTWLRPAWMGLAAAIAMLLAVGYAFWPRSAQAFADFAVADARLGALHGHGDRGTETNALQWTLSQPSTKLGQHLPIDFAKLETSGCRVIQYRHRDVLEVCFNRNGAWFHCYIGKRADFPELQLGSSPLLTESGGESIASWANHEQVVLIVTRSGRQALEALL